MKEFMKHNLGLLAIFGLIVLIAWLFAGCGGNSDSEIIAKQQELIAIKEKHIGVLERTVKALEGQITEYKKACDILFELGVNAGALVERNNPYLGVDELQKRASILAEYPIKGESK